MGGGRKHREERLNRILDVINKYLNVPFDKKKAFILSITKTSLNYIIEVIYNFLNCKFKIGYTALNKLKKFKKFLYDLVSRKKSITNKKKLLSSIRGLYVLNILLAKASISLEKCLNSMF